MRLDNNNVMTLNVQHITYDMAQSDTARWATINLLDSGSWASIKETS